MLAFADGTFDTVAISNSLHHMVDAAAVLQEMSRVVRPGGKVIVVEMYRDNETEAQATMMMLHDWAGEIDTAQGINHASTKTRADILSMVSAVDLVDLFVRDCGDPESDPWEEAFVSAGLDAISRYLPRTKGLARRDEFERRGEAMRGRLEEVGVQSQPGVFITGRKR